MSELLPLILKRRTTYEFSDRNVSATALNKIVEAGRWAPSVLNLQPWSFIIVRNKRTIDELMRACYYGYFHYNPPVLIAIVSEPIDSEKRGATGGKMADFFAVYKPMSLGLPAFSMTLEAESIGVGSCILSPEPKKANRILNVPNGRQAVLLVGLGFERKGAFSQKRERKPSSKITFFEEYGATK